MNALEVYMDSLHLNRNPLLKGLLRKREGHLPKQNGEKQKFFWQAQAYGLDRSTLFQEASLELQNKILAELSQARLEEAYHIEKAGIAFGAKMILESKTFEERRLYAHFTAEESEHLAMVESYLEEVSDQHLSNSFLIFLAQIIKEAPKNVLTYIIQVILEGWGIEHYSELAKTCHDEGLKASLKKIVQDEAGHHGSGVILFDEKALSEEEQTQTQEIFAIFLQMVRIGPANLISTIQNQLSGDLELFLEEVKALEQTQKRLDSLKALALKARAFKMVAFCEEKGLFQTCSHQEMLSFYSPAS